MEVRSGILVIVFSEIIEINEKLLYLVNFLKQVIVYKSRFSFAYVDLRYKDMVVVKNNSFSTTD